MTYYLILTEKLTMEQAQMKDAEHHIIQLGSEQECRDAKDGMINLLMYGKEVDAKIRINRHEEGMSCEEFSI
jgi:hypothetical protein